MSSQLLLKFLECDPEGFNITCTRFEVVKKFIELKDNQDEQESWNEIGTIIPIRNGFFS